MIFKLPFPSGTVQIETVTPGEHRKATASLLQEQERDYATGFKYMRLNPPITGNPVAGALAMGGDSAGPQGGQPTGPRDGYAWSILRFSITGLATGVTPDVVNIYRRGPQARAAWSLTGNAPFSTFAKGQMLFLDNESIMVASVGAFAAAGLITLDADILELPQPLLWKLFA